MNQDDKADTDRARGGGTVVAIVKGGLGNQLFIYAAARALAIRTTRDLYLDATRGYQKDEYRRAYRLDRFAIEGKVMPEAWRVGPTLRHPRHKIIRSLNKLLPRDWRSYYAQRWNQGSAQLTTLEPKLRRITLLGYWQDERYFGDCADLIRRELAPPEPSGDRNVELGRKMEETESVFVHFRRTDYQYLVGADYYQAAIDEARARLSQPRFILFGDDLKWPLQTLNFYDSPREAVDWNAEDELADLWLMSRCRHAIIANSSFSWWGAFLGEQPSPDPRIVWAPEETGYSLQSPERWRRVSGQLFNESPLNRSLQAGCQKSSSL